MTRPRSTQVSLERTSYYHCMSRCVRKAFLINPDITNKKAYHQRQKIIKNKILALSKAFCINVPAYSVMSNHYHVILHVEKEKALSLSDLEVAKRWLKICKRDDLIKLFVDNDKLKSGEKKAVERRLVVIRERLYSISWFMRVINQDIASYCNREDKMSGAFWGSRFKSVALENEAAILACMAYVDLNPIRAKITKSLENSNFTSIKHRLKTEKDLDKPIIYIGQDKEEKAPDINITLKEYVALVKWTANNINKEKIEQSDESNKMIDMLHKKNIKSDDWIMSCENFDKLFTRSSDGTISLSQFSRVYGINPKPENKSNRKR